MSGGFYEVYRNGHPGKPFETARQAWLQALAAAKKESPNVKYDKTCLYAENFYAQYGDPSSILFAVAFKKFGSDEKEWCDVPDYIINAP